MFCGLFCVVILFGVIFYVIREKDVVIMVLEWNII